MATSLGSLVVSLGLDSAEFTRGLNKSQFEARKFSDNVADVGRQIGTILVASAAAGVAGLVALTKSAIDSADHLLDLSKKTGIAVETLGGIGFAAGQAGGDLESAAAAAGKLNKQLAEAAAGNVEAGEAFKALGIDVKNAAGATISADVAMAAIAEKFQMFQDGPEKAALALRLFGKAGADIIPLLNDGGDALRENIAAYQQFAGVTLEVAQQADEFNDTIGKLNLIAGSLGRMLAAELLPALQAVASAILAARQESEFFSTIGKGLRVVFETLAVVAANVAFVFAGVGREIGAIGAQIAALGRGDFAGFRAISDAVKADGVRARAELDALEKRIMGVTGRASGANAPFEANFPGPAKVAAPRLPAGIGGGGRSSAQSRVSEAQRYLETLQKQVEKTAELTAVEQARLDIQKGRIEGLTPRIKEEILATAQLIDAKKIQADLLKSEQQAREEIAGLIHANLTASASETAQLISGNEAMQHEIDLIGKDGVARAALENIQIESLITKKQLNLESLQEAGVINSVTAAIEDQIAALRDRQRLTTRKADVENFQEVQAGLNKQADETRNTLADSIEQGILEGFREGRTLGDIFLNELKAQFAKTILRPIIAPVAEAGNEFIGLLIRGLAGAAVGSASGGGATTGDFTRMDRAMSADVTGGAFINQKSRAVGVGAAMQPPIVQNINIGDFATRNDVMNAMQLATEKAKADILRSMHNRGSFANA